MKPRLPMPVLLLCCIILHVHAAMAWAGKAERVSFAGTDFIVYWVDLKSDALSLCWKDSKGQQIGGFSRLQECLAAESKNLLFAINAGIYSTNGVPVGIHIEQSKELRPLNLRGSDGRQLNFYLKPNGVFYIADGKPAIAESVAYSKLNVHPELAAQSGPLLLLHGKIHPEFRPESINYRVRSGVGVTKDNKVVFVLSKQSLRFYDFARLFKEQLGCDDALYLDGEICSIYLPEFGYRADDALVRFAGMFAVTARTNAAPLIPVTK